MPVVHHLTDDQSLFRNTTARFIETDLPRSATRLLHDDPVGYTRPWLQRVAALGWFAMLVPEADGGGSVSDAGLLDAVIIAEEVGRHVQPGPFVPMNVVAAALAARGTPAQRQLLPGLVAGEAVATWAFADRSGNWDAGAGLSLAPSADGLALSGRRGWVQDAGSADWMLVLASRDGAPVHALVAADTPGISIRPLETLDLSRRLAHVDFDGVVVPADAVLGGPGDESAEDALHLAVVLNLAETIGAADALFEMTVAYAKDRIAFGRPIGSFQALKHVMADQAVYLEGCRAAVMAAARAVTAGAPNAAEVVSMAAAYVGDMANDVAQECLQIHGGIGYTWEHDLHLLLRRIRSNSALYGESTWHRERICRFHHLGEAS